MTSPLPHCLLAILGHEQAFLSSDGFTARSCSNMSQTLHSTKQPSKTLTVAPPTAPYWACLVLNCISATRICPSSTATRVPHEPCSWLPTLLLLGQRLDPRSGLELLLVAIEFWEAIEKGGDPDGAPKERGQGALPSSPPLHCSHRCAWYC